MHFSKVKRYTRAMSVILAMAAFMSSSPVQVAYAAEDPAEEICAYNEESNVGDNSVSEENAAFAAMSSINDGESRILYEGHSIQNTTAWLPQTSFSYTGREICPKPVVYYEKEQLIEEYDYTLEYQNNVEIGTATVIIHGTGDYSGYKALTYSIGKKSLTDESLFKVDFQNADMGSSTDATYYFTGDAIKPDVKCTFDGKEMTLGVDYTVTYENNKDVGQAIMTFNGMGEYSNSASRKFMISPRSILADGMKVIIDNAKYTGNEVRPDMSVVYNDYTLKEGTDYSVEYSGDVEVGTAYLTITGTGNFKDERKAKFNILEDGKELTEAKVKFIKGKKFTFTGDRIKPEIQVNVGKRVLQLHTDYELVYDDAREAGNHEIYIRGVGNEYVGHTTVSYKIRPGDIDELVTVSSLPNIKYTGEKIEQKPVVWFRSEILDADKDYRLKYSKNLKAGTSMVRILGKGSFRGQIKLKYQILPWDVADAHISTVSDLSYNGKAQTPKLTLSLNGMSEKAIRRSFKIVVDKGAIGVGRYEATVIGKGSLSGVTTVSYNIVSSDLENCTVKYPTSVSIKKSTGTAEPKITVKNGKVRLVKDRDYSITYENNTERGTGRAILKGIGGYTGEKTVYYRVK